MNRALLAISVIDPTYSGVVAVLSFAIFILGLVPSFIAFARNHRRRRAILMLNLLAGWTAIGWAIAAAWSSTENIEERGALPARAQPSKKPPGRVSGARAGDSAFPTQAANARRPARGSCGPASRS